MGQRLDEFSDLLLQMYRLSAEQALEDYQHAVLNLLKPVLAFDGCMWGTATYKADQGLDIHTIHLHNQSPAMLAEYEDVKHLDTSATLVVSKPQVTQGFHSPTWFDAPLWDDYRDWQRRHGHENVFISSHNDFSTGASQWVSLFRSDPDHHCREDEVRLLAQLSPHLMQGLQQNRVRQLGAAMPFDGMGHEAAIVDARGMLHHATPGCDALLRAEWGKAWRPGWVPAPLMDWLTTRREPYVGRAVVVTRRIRQDLMFVHMRARCPADALTARQRQIADLAALGMTHKEAAQRLGLSPATVRNQIRIIYDKLGVTSVAALIAALRQAW